MREKWQKQMSLIPTEIDHPQAKELEAISQILNSQPTIYGDSDGDSDGYNNFGPKKRDPQPNVSPCFYFMVIPAGFEPALPA